MPDLSTAHQPLTDLFPSRTQLEDQLRLSSEQLESYRENGFVGPISLLNAEQLERLRDELTRFFDPEHEGRELWYEYHANEATTPDAVLFHALGAWRIGAAFHDLLWNPAFTVVAEQLLEGPVRFWHDQLFCKPALHGGVVAWHQDYSYWTRTQPMAHLTCWIAMDDADAENGVIQYIPGSHQWDLLPITGLAGDMDAIQDVLSDEQWELFQRPVAKTVPAGSAMFHHPLTVHGSDKNHTDRPRRAAVLNVIRDGVCSASDDPLLDGVPAVPNGRRLEGQFFPRLS